MTEELLKPLRALKCQEINIHRALLIERGFFEYNGRRFDSRTGSQIFLMGLVTLANAGIIRPANFKFRTFDNEEIEVTNTDIHGMFCALMDRLNDVASASFRFKEAVQALPDFVALENYHVDEQPWP